MLPLGTPGDDGAGGVPEGAENEKVGFPDGAGMENDGGATLEGSGGGGREDGAGREPEKEDGAGAAKAAATKARMVVKASCIVVYSTVGLDAVKSRGVLMKLS